jgi:rRNA maturation protein Nop10
VQENGNTNKPPTPPDSCESRLDAYLREKRERDQAKRDAELLVRAKQIRTLQGLLGPVATVHHTCSQCGHVDIVLDPRPIAPDDDYDTRI